MPEIQQPIDITYTFQVKEGEAHVFKVLLDPQTLNQLDVDQADPPAWTDLAVMQCSRCPLARDKHQYCPVALSLVQLVNKCNRLLSYDEIDVTVKMADRTVSKKCTAQKGLSSLLGLLMATSGCPTMSFLKPMARFHTPFATRHETVFRAVSAYLLAQYFHNNNGRPCDIGLQGLQDIYTDIHSINMNMARRLRTIAEGDAHLNAIILLDVFAQELPTAIDSKLKDLEHLFAAYVEPVGESGREGL